MANNTVFTDIKAKIQNADSILIALSKNPGVDELATAIGLSMMLDKMGKNATAIYSGTTPDVLSFLQPENRLEKTVNGLQDFVIAINKDKADHLRYKVDGDYVKVFITPYRTMISEKDLDFSYGDFNVDLVIALNVAIERDLDDALFEYGRILHDASVINISIAEGASFGELKWADPLSSSMGELVGKLALEMGDEAMDGDIATALLTGIVVCTERFSNAKTTPITMGVAAKLMAAGANQQLIASQIDEGKMREINQSVINTAEKAVAEKRDQSTMKIEHDEAGKLNASEGSAGATAQDGANAGQANPSVNQTTEVVAQTNSSVNQTTESAAQANPSVNQTTESAAQPEEKKEDVQSVIDSIMQRNGPEGETAEEGNAGVADVNIQAVIDKVASEKRLADEAKKEAIQKEPDVEGNVIGGNPALMATPGVEDKAAYALPNMTFNQNATEPLEKPLPEESYVHEEAMKTVNQPVDLKESDVVVQPMNKEDLVLTPPEREKVDLSALDLPMPGDGTLPPPPLPPVNF